MSSRWDPTHFADGLRRRAGLVETVRDPDGLCGRAVDLRSRTEEDDALVIVGLVVSNRRRRVTALRVGRAAGPVAPSAHTASGYA